MSQQANTPGGAHEDPAFWLRALERHAQGNARSAITRRKVDGSFEETTHAELAIRARRLAGLFAELTEPGQIIPLCLARSADCVAAMLGALLADRAFCCINPKMRLPQIEHILRQTRAPLAMVDDTGMMALRGEPSPDSPVRAARWLLMGADALGRPAQRLAEQLRASASLEAWDSVGARPWEPDTFCSRPTTPASTAATQGLGCCLFTSGSTGTPKGVLIARSDLAARAWAEVEWFSLTGADVLLNILPFSFDVGLNQVLSAVVSGAELVVLESWFVADILKAATQRGVSGISAVPSIWADFVRAGKRFDREGPHRALRYVTVSGGDLSPAQHAQLPAVVQGAQVFKTYGQTEAFRLTSLHPDDYAARPASVGRPFASAQVHIAREDGTRAAPLEHGEVVHTGLGTMLGYLDGQDPEHKLRENPWRSPACPHAAAVFTGDIGYLDEQGFLFLVGRRDDLLKIQGNRVYPGEVRNQIAEQSEVAAVEVVPVRREGRVHLAAFIVTRAGEQLDEARFRLQLMQRMPSYMVPDLIAVLPELPRTASGKPDRPSLVIKATEMLP